MIGKPTTEWKTWNIFSEKGKQVALRRRAANRKEWQELKRAGTHTAASQQNTSRERSIETLHMMLGAVNQDSVRVLYYSPVS